MHRELFDIEPGLVLLDQCVIGPVPKRCAEAVCSAIQGHAKRAIRGMPGLPVSTEAVEACRTSLARLINADADDICLIKNTVEGLNIVANGVRWKSGENIVSARIEFPANIYAWMKLAERGVELRLAEIGDGKVTPEKLFALVDKNTRAIAVSFVQYLNGYRADLKAIGRFCRERGILLIVDAIQGLGALDIDVKEANIDFLAAGGHKWMLSPVGSGVFYCRKELAAEMYVTNLGHLSVKKSKPFTEINYDLKDNARRFEGGVVSYSAFAGMRESVDMFLKVGTARIEKQIVKLGDQAVEGLKSLGYPVVSHRAPEEKSGIVAFALSSEGEAESIHQALDRQNIVISRHANTLRVAPHFYNDESDIEAFLAALRSAQ